MEQTTQTPYVSEQKVLERGKVAYGLLSPLNEVSRRYDHVSESEQHRLDSDFLANYLPRVMRYLDAQRKLIDICPESQKGKYTQALDAARKNVGTVVEKLFVKKTGSEFARFRGDITSLIVDLWKLGNLEEDLESDVESALSLQEAIA